MNLTERLLKEPPSRELDAEIDCALRIGPTDKSARWIWNNFPTWRSGVGGYCEVVHDNGRGGVRWKSARFTTSIDAALTLIPDDLFWLMSRGRVRPNEPLYGAQLYRDNGSDRPIAEAESDHLAMAICIAALKAREDKEKRG